jgi:YspA, cpYpsA-related SLOG family
MIVVATGSRDLQDPTRVFRALDECLASANSLVVYHGDHFTGADTYVEEWFESKLIEVMVTEMPGKPIAIRPKAADWGRFGRSAGPKRNRAMMKAATELYEKVGGPIICLAFKQDGAGNRGTTDCMNAAEEYGVEVRER